MGDFDTTMETAAEAAFAYLGTEQVTYTPNGGAARTVTAVVRRMGIDGDLNVPIAQIKVKNSATLGLAAAAIDTGGDSIAWSPKRGGTTRTSRITALVSADAGFVTVEVA